MPSERRLSTRQRSALVAALLAITLVVAVAPRPISTPIARVADYRADPPGPIWNTSIDDAAIRKAARIIPRGAVFVVVDGSPRQAGNPATILHHDLLGSAYIHLLPAVPAVRLADAGWAIGYHQTIPKALTAERWSLGPGIELVRLRRA